MNIIFPQTPTVISNQMPVPVYPVNMSPLVQVVFRGPPGVSGNAATISNVGGNSLTIEEDGGLFVQVNPLASAQW